MAGKALKMRCTGKIKTMKNTTNYLPYLLAAGAAAILFATAGCVPITSHLDLNPQAGVVSWVSPKDVTVDSIEAGSSNGIPYLIVKNWRSSNNPEVLKAKGDADASVAKVYVDGILSAVQAGVSAYTTAGASTVTTAAINALRPPVTIIQQAKPVAAPVATPTP